MAKRSNPKRLLDEGDVIVVKPGMKIYASVPEWAAYSNVPDSSLERVQALVKVGVPRRCNKKKYGTSYLAGKYVVEDARSAGGGTGHGSSDVYAGGHRVVARKLTEIGSYDEYGELIEFYQTGDFTAVVAPGSISIVGKMRKHFL